LSVFVGAIQAMVSRIGPYFLHGKNIGTFLESFAKVYDDGAESLTQGILQADPFQCDAESLPGISRDRRIRLYPTETEASKRLRLSQWLQLHRTRGTHIGQLKHAQPFFMPDTPVMRIVHQDGLGATATWHTIAADGTYSIHEQVPSNWDYDGLTTHWSRWWVIIYIPAQYIASVKWDDGGKYDAGSPEVYDGVLTSAIMQGIVNMFLEWNGAHSRLGAVILATDPASFDPTAFPLFITGTSRTTLPMGNWGTAISPPPASVYTRLDTAKWIYEGVP